MVFPQWISSGLLAAVQVEQTRMRAKSVCFMPDRRTVPSCTRQPRKEHEGGRLNRMRRVEGSIFRPA